MIIETRHDVVRLFGSLHKNQWLTIRAAVNLLLQDHPQGIIIDCSALEEVSEDGAKTFLEAMRDVEAVKSRIVLVSLPQKVLAVCRLVPGVRSQLPLADTLEEARASLRLGRKAAARPKDAHGKAGQVIVVPLIADYDLTYGANLAGRLSRGAQTEIRLVYFLEVARTLPLGAPLQEAEQGARDSLERAQQYIAQMNLRAEEHVERVRELREGIIASLRAHNATLVVLGAASEPMTGQVHDEYHELVDTLLHRAPCEVVIGRLKAGE